MPCVFLSCEEISESVIFFFFSSRRRHTRFSRDWSSDVCSSDLTVPAKYWDLYNPDALPIPAQQTNPKNAPDIAVKRDREISQYRSEERRVGKECRSRWAP